MPDPLTEEGIIGLSEVGSLMQNVEKINRDADYELSGTTAPQKWKESPCRSARRGLSFPIFEYSGTTARNRELPLMPRASNQETLRANETAALRCHFIFKTSGFTKFSSRGVPPFKTLLTSSTATRPQSV